MEMKLGNSFEAAQHPGWLSLNGELQSEALWLMPQIFRPGAYLAYPKLHLRLTTPQWQPLVPR